MGGGAGGQVEILSMPAQVSGKHEGLCMHARNRTFLFLVLPLHYLILQSRMLFPIPNPAHYLQ